MSLNMKMIYSDNPYVDVLVYYTKLLGLDTVLKMSEQANKNETLESKKNADLYIACMEDTAVLGLFENFSEDVLRSIGITGAALINAIANPSSIPDEYKDKLLQAVKKDYIAHYEEKNNYYRMLNGLPPIGYNDIYIKDWIPPEGVIIDLTIPVHEMSTDAIAILDANGVIDDMYQEDPQNRAYLKYINKKIPFYAARKAMPFEALYIPTIDSLEITNEYKMRLEGNRQYALQAVYSEAYKYNSDYYDNFIAVFIVLNTITDIVARVQEFITRKEVFDIRTVRYIFESNGVPYFPEIPMKYQIRMVKNLHTLLKYKSTSKCMVDICSLFGFENIKIFKYYLLHSRKYNSTEDEFSITGDDEEDFNLQFVKIPIDGNMEDYIRDPTYRVGYDEITDGDPAWDGGLEHDDVKTQHLSADYNYTRTKYISVDSIYDIAKMAIQQCYFFNMLYDNKYLESQIAINIPYIDPTKQFNIADIFVFLSILTYQSIGIKDMLLDTQGKILTVYGFDFNANLAEIATNLNEILESNDLPKFYSRIMSKKLIKEEVDKIKEQTTAFNIPTDSIPGLKQLMNLFTNNLDVRDVLVSGMRQASNLRIYNAYKYLFDSLMTMELTMDFFMNPETGNYYRDIEGDATYTEWIRHRDSTLYYKLVEIEMMDDPDNKAQYVANLVDNVVYVLEEFIDTEKFAGLFRNLPAVSEEAVKQYIKTVIDFYKSYKVHFLGINTLYTLDDKFENWIKVIDTAFLFRFFEKEDIATFIDRISKMSVEMSKYDKVAILDKVYMDISTWVYTDQVERLKIRDTFGQLLSKLNLWSAIIMDETYNMMSQKDAIEFIKPLDLETNREVTTNPKDKIESRERITITPITE